MGNLWTLAQVFRRSAQEHPEHTMVVAGSSRSTYAQVDARSSSLAAAMAELGIGSGDRVAIILPNRSEWIVALLACAKLGAVVVPVNPRLDYHELKYHLRHAAVSVAFTAEQYDGIDFLQYFEDVIAELPDLRYLVTVGEEELWYDDRIVRFEDLVSSGEGRRIPEPSSAGDDSDLALLYTSGTMGKPKGVRLSHRAVIETAVLTGDAIGLGAADRILVALPLFTIFGFGVVAGAVAVGATLVLQDEFHARDAIRLVQAERVTVLNGVPTMFHLMMRDASFDRNHLRTLRGGVIAGGSVPADLVDRVRDWCNVDIAYGLTETGTAVTVTRQTDPADKRSTTVGRPLPGVEVKVVDFVTGVLHGPEAVGEIAVRGPNVMPGYARMPAETRRSFTPEGFFLTGDLGIIDEDGYVRIVGRHRETILRGGSQIYPREVEDQLRAHPAVDDVCVIGVPHDIMGELMCACIGPVPDLVRFLDAFPITGSGTVKRRELERMVALDHTAIMGSS